jgi:hypothetical protein
MNENRSDRLVEFLEKLVLMLAIAVVGGTILGIWFILMTNDPQRKPPPPPPQKVILPDGREGIVTEVIVNPDGTRSFKVKENS